jgi:hypothetical protein
MCMWLVIVGFAVAGAILAAGILLAIRRKNMGYWLHAYLVPAQPREAANDDNPLHIFLAICDHWEPQLNGASPTVAMAKVERWVQEYPQRYAEFRDSDGRTPQHTFFFPAEEYRPEYLDKIGELCRAGYGDVDVHLHHKDDSAAALEDKLDAFRKTLFDRHGLLRKDPRTGEIGYGFIHGNWALCNSAPDGAWCGVDQELSVLLKTGCYADFTMPSAPSPTQTRTINSIYYARDIPGQRKSHDVGIIASVGRPAPRDHLLMIQGPLTLDWEQRRAGILPRIENGDVTAGRAMSMRRLKHWLSAGVHVRGQPNWLFVKLHTHGCNDANMEAWLRDEMLQFHRGLSSMAQQDRRFNYHYVTAWQMAQLVHQAEAGATVPVKGVSPQVVSA